MGNEFIPDVTDGGRPPAVYDDAIDPGPRADDEPGRIDPATENPPPVDILFWT